MKTKETLWLLLAAVAVVGWLLWPSIEVMQCRYWAKRVPASANILKAKNAGFSNEEIQEELLRQAAQDSASCWRRLHEVRP
jgi:hypothetical protein